MSPNTKKDTTHGGSTLLKRPSMGRPPEPPTTKVYFRLPDKILDSVDAAALASGLSRTQYLRMQITRMHSGANDASVRVNGGD